ncbi:MAG: hypothetical protein FD143_2647 [Ignavibacteria bacterium]|nr:MAG: hypothetical protein FD143_2647 [Ignavibacteria bacterium]KAF0156193.1 MAG: hypothetical protein FD188_3006 [Ignavibacteria bacterium]
MKYFLIVLFLCTTIEAQTILPTQIDKQIIGFTFNEDFSQARKISQEQINKNPNSPKYYYYMINAKILEYYQKVAELAPEKREEGRKKLNREIIKYCEGVVQKFEDASLNTENKFYFSTIYGYLARVYGVDGSWWSAFRTGLKAKNLAEEVIKANSNFYDAYLVIGMLNYYSDRLSGVAGFIAGALGFSGDREKGLSQLRLAYEKGSLTFGQSAQTLIEVYSSLEDNETAAIPVFENFLMQFPENKRTLNAFCLELMSVWEFKKVESIIKADNRNLVSEYVKARFYDMRAEGDNAIKFGEAAVENEREQPRGGVSASRYIVVYNAWLDGDNVRIRKHYAELNERSLENFNLAKKYERENKWLRELTSLIAKDKSVAEFEAFTKTSPDFKNLNDLADQHNYLMGSFYYKNNLFDKAETWFKKSVTSKNERLRNTAVKHLLEIYLKATVDKSKAKYLADVINDIDNDRLSYRARDLEKKYNL